MTEHDAETRIPAEWLVKLRAARDRAHVPYSRHPVGALIVGADGAIHCACNVETAHFKSVCAEAGAISAMVSAGEKRIREVWILGPGPNPCPPCGDCRQRIFELADRQSRVYLIDEAGQVFKSYGVSTLLPDAFG